MIKRSPHPSFSFPHPSLAVTPSPLLLPFLFLILEEWKDSKWRACATGLAGVLSCCSFEKRSRSESGRVESGARVYMRACTSAEIFLKERRLTGTRSGKSLERVHLRRGVGKKWERKTDEKRKMQWRRRKKESEKREKEVSRKRYEGEGIHRRNGWSFGRTWRVGVRQLERGIARKRIDGERKRNEAW